MKKLSVNGKTFDEIFKERGEQVNISECMPGGIYLFSDGGDSSIFEHGGKAGYSDIFSSELILSSEFSVLPQKYAVGAVADVFTATPNQIALLNAYRND